MFNSDKSVKEYAVSLQNRFKINMNLKDMFSDDLNNYFNYNYDRSNDIISFYFELDSGPCVLSVENPYTDNEFFTYNKNLSQYISI